jgi:hypothetical protein
LNKELVYLAKVPHKGTMHTPQSYLKIQSRKFACKKTPGAQDWIRFSASFKSGVKATVYHHLVSKGEYLGWLEIKRN